MRILVVCQHYWPEPFAVSDVCETLVRRGHEVAVLTGLPNYPEGELYAGYDDPSVFVQEHQGVRVFRAVITPRKHGIVHRVANYYSFSRRASRLARDIDFDADVVLAYQTSPVMMANPALAYAKRTGAPVLLYCVDIWPECLVAGGIKQGGAIYNHYKKVARSIYSNADALAVTSPLFADYFRDVLGMNPGYVAYLAQYAEDVFEASSLDVAADAADAVAVPHGYDAAKINLTFAGNVGTVQSVDTIVRAAAHECCENIVFHIVGSGSDLARCEGLARSLAVDNVVFHGRKPLEDMPRYYAASDAMLATFADEPLLGYTLPRKIQSYMAAGKPVVAAAAGETRRVVEAAKCGWCCDPCDSEGLARLCAKVAGLRADELARRGACGRTFFEQHFSKQRFFDALERELENMKGTNHGEHAGI